MDEDLNNIKLVLKDESIDPEEFYACAQTPNPKPQTPNPKPLDKDIQNLLK